MKFDETGSKSRDIFANLWFASMVFWLPVVVLIASGFLDVGQGWRTAIWVVALTTMGAGCVVNAFRCRRVHCYFTAPFFLVMALVSLLYGLGIVPLGKSVSGWNMIGLVVLVGTLLLIWLPEILLGRYRRGRGT